MDERYTFEQIEAYLDGDLEPREEAGFEAALLKDETLREAVEAHRATRRAVDAYAAQRTQERVKHLFAEHQRKSRLFFSKHVLRIAAAIAMVLALGISYLYLTSGPDAQQLAEQYLEPYPDRITTMSAEEAGPLSRAIAPYNEKDYTAALEAFRAVPEDHPQQQLVQLYIGVSALETGAETEAVNALAPLAEQPGDYQAAAQWYLALAYLQQGKADAAVPLLEALAGTGGYKAESAEKILEKVGNEG